MKNDLVAYWLQLFFQENIDYVMEKLQASIGQEILFFTSKKQFVSFGSTRFSEKDFKKVEIVTDPALNLDKQVDVVHNGKLEFYSYTILDPNDQIIGYFLFEKKGLLDDAVLQLLQAVTLTMITWVKQVELTRNLHLKYKDQFMFDLLHNNVETEKDLIQLGKLREMEFMPNACVIAMNLHSNQALTKDVLSAIQNMMIDSHFDKMRVYTTYLSHRIVAIICPSVPNIEITKQHLDQWIHAIQRQISHMFPFIQTMVGVGRSYQAILDIYKSFQEAKIALQMQVYGLGTNGIIHYNDIGYVRLLSYVHDDLLTDFSNHYLGDLVAADRENETEYVQTLHAYCNYSGDIAKTADHLYIHQNTLRQRLKKIESILNIELHHYTDLVNLILSLKIHQNRNL